MDNKELIQKLKDYYLAQDHEKICYILAAMMIDVRRIAYSDKLPEKELRCLIWRLDRMAEEVDNFEGGVPFGELKIIKMNEARGL